MLHRHPPKRVEQMRRGDETWFRKSGWGRSDYCSRLVELQTLVIEWQGGSLL